MNRPSLRNGLPSVQPALYTRAMGCYCEERRTNPALAETMADIPEGYCGICEVCGAPGHTRAHPRAPVTSAWCDEHYAALTRPGLRTDGIFGVVVILLALAALAAALLGLVR